MSEELLMMRQRLFCLPVFVRLLEDLKTCDDASLHFIQGHQSSEFDIRSAFVARNDASVRFEETQNLLLRGHLLALQHARPRLSDHAPDQWEELLDLFAEALGDLLTSSAQRLAHPLSLLHHLFGRLHQALIQLTLLGAPVAVAASLCSLRRGSPLRVSLVACYFSGNADTRTH